MADLGDLRPCPFCGSQHLDVWRMGLAVAINCLDCGAYGPGVQISSAKAKDRWNERVTSKEELDD